MIGQSRGGAPRNDAKQALRGALGAFVGVGMTTGVLNVLGLTGSLYMLQVYDRAIPGRSVPTLVALTVIMGGLYAAQGFFDVIRTRLLTRIGARLDAKLRERVFSCVLKMPLLMRSSGHDLDPTRDLDTIRAFLSGTGPTALFDLPWIPLYLTLVFVLHPSLGWLATGGAAIVILLTIVTEFRTKAPAKAAAESGALRRDLGEASRRNAEAIAGLGMAGAFTKSWNEISARHLKDQVRAADVATTLAVSSKIIRMALQSAVLGLGAYLVIEGQVTSGVMIAASITVARALAPVEIAVANWRGFLGARHSYSRLSQLMAALPPQADLLQLPAPTARVAVENLTVGAPATAVALIRDVSFKLEAGQALGVIGMSGSGKSTLARAMVGAWKPLRGAVRLDGAALDQWQPAQLGQHLGYLPQGIELFDGTIAENIARFTPDASAESIVNAARMAGVDQLIMRLANGYQTRIGEGGSTLSAGQRQRIGLARALYGDPFLLVLDEPNSNLDTDGEGALTQAIINVRERGGIVVVIAHRSSALAAVDQLLVMSEGAVLMFGPRDSVLQALARQRAGLQAVASNDRPQGQLAGQTQPMLEAGR
jgi:PrtD family type I secretion system ABC transporter